MPSTQEMLQFRGQDLYDANGDKIGKVEEIYEDTDTGAPEWALVHTGLFGTKRTFVPLREASTSGSELRVPYDKSQVKDAPGVDPDGALSRDEEQRLYQHYGMNWSTSDSGSGLGDGGTQTQGFVGGTTDQVDDRVGPEGPAVGRDTSGPTTDSAMTRSEEELRVGKTQTETGVARLRKYIVTENVQTTVPVQREEVRIEREPITDANIGAATEGPALSEEEHEVTLHAEQAVVDKQVVPKERVRLDKDVVTEEQQVSESVSKEQIEIEGGGTTTGRQDGLTDRDRI